jgi:hypothetical protein
VRRTIGSRVRGVAAGFFGVFHADSPQNFQNAE